MNDRSTNTKAPASTLLTRRSFTKGVSALSLGAATGTIMGRPALAQGASPLVFTWAGWDDAALHQPFIDENGTAPEFAFFADTQDAFTKARSGFKADIFEVAAPDTRKWYDAGLVQPLDPERLTHWDDFHAPMRDLEGQWIDDELYYVPTMYGGISILYRADMVDAEESWTMLWDERFDGRIAPIDFPIENVVQVGLGLGVPDPFNMSDAELELVREALVKQTEYSKFYWDNPTVAEQALVSGEIWVACAWSEMAPRVGGLDVPIVYANPKEGRLATQDGLMIAAEPSVDLDVIYDYINARTSPGVGAYCMQNFGMVNPNARALELTPLDIVSAMGADDIATTMATNQSFKPIAPDREQAYSQLVFEIRAG